MHDVKYQYSSRSDIIRTAIIEYMRQLHANDTTNLNELRQRQLKAYLDQVLD